MYHRLRRWIFISLEDEYGIVLSTPCGIPDTELGKALSDWRQLSEKQKNGDIGKEEYDEWRLSF